MSSGGRCPSHYTATVISSSCSTTFMTTLKIRLLQVLRSTNDDNNEGHLSFQIFPLSSWDSRNYHLAVLISLLVIALRHHLKCLCYRNRSLSFMKMWFHFRNRVLLSMVYPRLHLSVQCFSRWLSDSLSKYISLLPSWSVSPFKLDSVVWSGQSQESVSERHEKGREWNPVKASTWRQKRRRLILKNENEHWRATQTSSCLLFNDSHAHSFLCDFHSWS